MAFRIGDRVVIVQDTYWPARVGLVCVITSNLRPASFACRGGTLPGTPVYETNAPTLHANYVAVYEAHEIEPYRPDHYDKLSTADEPLSELLPRTIRDLCSAGDLERAKRKVGA